MESSSFTPYSQLLEKKGKKMKKNQFKNSTITTATTISEVKTVQIGHRRRNNETTGHRI